jgi:hypothetical protein
MSGSDLLRQRAQSALHDEALYAALGIGLARNGPGELL